MIESAAVAYPTGVRAKRPIDGRGPPVNRQLKERPEPYLTLNAFGHYVMTKDARERRAILRGMKFHHPGKQGQYSAALQGITAYLCDEARDPDILAKAAERLKAGAPTSDHDAVRRRICGEALSCALAGIDAFKHDGLDHSRACLTRHRIRAGGVVISCYPEVLIRGTVRGKKVVGAIKLRLCKTPKFDDEAGSLCATILRSQITHAEARADERVDRRLCRLVDVFNGCRVHEAPLSVKKRREQVISTCEEIALLWPSIERSTAKSGF